MHQWKQWIVFLVLLGSVVGEEDKRAGDTRVKRYPKHLDPFYFPWVRNGECQLSLDGAKMHFCPTLSNGGRWMCVDDYQLCDGVKNCPNAEDESAEFCLFHRVLKSKINLLTSSIAALKSSHEDTDGEEGSLEPFQGEEQEELARKSHRQWGRFIPAEV